MPSSSQQLCVVKQQLASTQAAAHSYRIKVSGSILTLGTILFAGSQIVLIMHGRGLSPLGVYGPPVGGVATLLGQATMLLALQPSDKYFSLVAATLLVCLCVYMISSFPYATISEYEAIEATRSWLLHLHRTSRASPSLRFLRRRPPHRS